MQQLVQANLITLPIYKKLQEPQVKLPWYNEKHLFDFHKIKGHTTPNCMRLKNLIQDLINDKFITIDQLAENQDLKIYMNPMSDHNKGNNNGKVNNYTNVNHICDHFVAYLDEFVTVVNIKGPRAECGVTTRNDMISIPGPSPPPRESPANPKSNPNAYSILEKLKKTSTQISIMELLKILPAHTDILKKALVAFFVPRDIDADQFQAMVKHITTPHLLTFSKRDLPTQPSHNRALHLEVLVHKNKVKQVLVDGGASLNVCTL